MTDYITTQQYPPLIPPKSWGSEEKKFLNQLTDILDDIYRRYGRLRFEDLGTKLKTRIVASEDILLEVSQERIFRAATEVALLAALAALTPPIAMAVNLLWYDTTNKLFKRCTAVGPPIVWETLQANEIHTSFIDIAGDSIDIGSGGSLNITAPTLLSILAGSGSSAVGIKNDTYFLFAGNATPAEAPFSVTMEGVLKALTGLFAGTLKITNPNNADEQIIVGENADGDFGGFITRDNGATFIRWLDFDGLDGAAITPGSFDPLAIPTFTYTGSYAAISDGVDGWRIKFLTSGTFTPSVDMTIDVFLVGGGGAGGGGGSGIVGGGGGGGYTNTVASKALTADTPYSIVVGAGGTYNGGNGSASTAFTESANGGSGGESNDGTGTPSDGGNGGSGGGGAGGIGDPGGNGGYNGTAGYNGTYGNGGTGQTSTTGEFGNSSNTLYGGGGGGCGSWGGSGGYGGEGGSSIGGLAGNSPYTYGYPGTTNTGGGGGGGIQNHGGNGGSGIVVIRNHRA